MSHHAWSRVGKSTEGRWSGVKSTDSNPLVFRCKGPGCYLAFSSIDSETYRFDRVSSKGEKLSLLTLTIGEALLGQIVASGLVTDGGTRFATFVVATAILDGGAMFFTTFHSIVIQRGGRAADHQQHYDEQCHHRRIHPRIVTRYALSSPTTNTIRSQRCSKKPSWVGNILVLEKQVCVSKILKLIYTYMKVFEYLNKNIERSKKYVLNSSFESNVLTIILNNIRSWL